MSSQAVAPQPRSVSVGLTEKAHATIVEEARRRGVTPERLTLAALLDYLGRHGKTQGAKASPLVLHIPWFVRKHVIEAARAEGMTPNQFMISAAVKAAVPIEAKAVIPGRMVRRSTLDRPHNRSEIKVPPF
jgi:hypothetical protein